ncbi:hypothetical protein KXV81_009381 [Aspergillus fumigatus]|nr:hypothetical protein KXX41_009058 [Aspergillus fumigatus]KAH1841531.1 hypothetical protein KXX43_008484 [Aspergillus fumigatus]KAH2002686.1 hypothetical protein KXV80_008676 [Aspergillus fumigatus]KAH2012427.1 hypothetical protein KXV97_008330 [Aspergillus fumigatus]KAH2128240.1 hypothetical protein KXW66_009419 [Aspergillus fumigatus]
MADGALTRLLVVRSAPDALAEETTGQSYVNGDALTNSAYAMVIFNHRVFLAGEYVTAEKSKPEIESRLPPRIRPWTCQLSRQDVEGLPSGPVTDLLENPDNGNNSSREVGIFSSWQMV